MNRFVRFTDLEVKLRGIDSRPLYMEHYLRRASAQTTFHLHAFWQLEMIVSGRVTADLGSEEYPLDDGDILVIPPGIRHQFRYTSGSTEFYSVKFVLEPAGPLGGGVILDDRGDTSALRRRLLDSLSDDSASRQEMVVAVKYALDALIELEYLRGERSVKKDAGLVGRVRTHIERRAGARVTVAEIAGELGHTRGHVSQLFRARMGIPLKAYIDQQRLRSAMSLIQFSDRSLSEIAYTLGFPDLFSFSKFFKRVSGRSPRDYQKETHPEGG